MEEKLYAVVNERTERVIKEYPIIGETRMSFIVGLYGNTDILNKNLSYKVKKKDMIANIRDFRYTHLQFYRNMKELDNYLFCKKYSLKISEAVRYCKDAKTLKDISKKLDMNNIKDI